MLTNKKNLTQWKIKIYKKKKNDDVLKEFFFWKFKYWVIMQ
jgi:hypothetical protein